MVSVVSGPPAMASQEGTSQDPVSVIEPLVDPRWEQFVNQHPRASLFHSSSWLHALCATYGYEAVAYTTVRDGSLSNALVFCRVDSWLTGRRMVSLPFSDHCEPLLDGNDAGLRAITTAIEQSMVGRNLRYLELRPVRSVAFPTSMAQLTIPFSFHELDLTPDIDTLFKNCHHSSTQRKIRRAEREGLVCAEGSSDDLLRRFYELFTATRKRHHLPPPPRQWFVNLIRYFGDALKIRVAFKGSRHIAAILTIRHKETMTYKYGGCDPHFTNLGSMHFLLWRSITEAKFSGMHTFDFGRSDADQPGLILFKSRWGTRQSTLTYRRFTLPAEPHRVSEVFSSFFEAKSARWLAGRMPAGILTKIGTALYGHAA